jgi:uncharacterized membrane protein
VSEPREQTVEQRHNAIFGRKGSTERLQFFSDAVFAIAMTIMVLDLKLPEDLDHVTFGAILDDVGPQLLAYAISFLIISINWVNHHSRMRVIAHTTNQLLWANLIVLFFIALIPFPTSVLSEHGSTVPSVVLYSAAMACSGLASTAMWMVAYREGLVVKEIDRDLYRYDLANNLVMPVVFGLSIPVAFLAGAHWAMVFWVIDWPGAVIVGRVLGRRRSGARA